ncbi:guanylate-binding 6-like, partial [Paramuricea clavata]
LKCVTYDHDGRCCGGLLYTFLTHNREKSEKFCNDIIDGLIKKDLEPLLQNINHTSSFEVIHSVIKGIENKYWSRAIGPAAGDVFKMFHTSLEERKKRAMKVISQLADYNNEMEKERSEKLRMEMARREAEQEKERLERQKEAQAQQHLEE